MLIKVSQAQVEFISNGGALYNLENDTNIENLANFKSQTLTEDRLVIISDLNLSLLIENSSNRPKFALKINPVVINLSGPTFKNIILLVDEIVETTKNKET